MSLPWVGLYSKAIRLAYRTDILVLFGLVLTGIITGVWSAITGRAAA
jgi:hypothetical protein